MYFHRIMTAFAFVFMFSIIEFIFATIAWKGLGEHLWHKLHRSFIDQEHTDVVTVSEASDDISDLQSISGAASDKSV